MPFSRAKERDLIALQVNGEEKHTTEPPSPPPNREREYCGGEHKPSHCTCLALSPLKLLASSLVLGRDPTSELLRGGPLPSNTNPKSHIPAHLTAFPISPQSGERYKTTSCDLWSLPRYFKNLDGPSKRGGRESLDRELHPGWLIQVEVCNIIIWLYLPNVLPALLSVFSDVSCF